MKTFLLLTFYLILNNTLCYTQTSKSNVQFIQNNGQWSEQVLYSAAIQNGNIFLENNCLTWNFSNYSEIIGLAHDHAIKPSDSILLTGHSFKTNFLHAKESVQVGGEEQLSNYYNYFIGVDPAAWQGKVPAFGAVNYKGLYDGIDMRIYNSENYMKYDLIVAPHHDAGQIIFSYEGLNNIRINHGNLELITSLNKIVELAPVAYQNINGKKVYVNCSFLLSGNQISFDLPEGYDHDHELVIDPATLIFSTYSGSTTDNWGFAATYDAEGNAFGAGVAFNVGYPVTIGAYQETIANDIGSFYSDITISKFSSDGTNLIYSTYLGSAGVDLPISMSVNDDDELYKLAITGSTDFPVSLDAFDNSFNGGSNILVNGSLPFSTGIDLIISHFSADGSELLNSTYAGGNGNESIRNLEIAYNYTDTHRSSMMIDQDQNIVICSSTNSTDLPVTASALQPTLSGAGDGCIFKLNPSLNEMLFCTYFGGENHDAINSIAQTSTGNFVICGITNSTNLPASPGVISESYMGGITDGFIAVINNSGTSIEYLSYIGTDAYDQVYFVETDNADQIYVIGQSLGAFPVTAGTYINVGSTQFISKLNDSLSAYTFSTVIGDGENEINFVPQAFLVDEAENIFGSGWGGDLNVNFNYEVGNVLGMPITDDAFDTISDGSDLYFFNLSNYADTLIYATFFGSPHADEHTDGGESRFDENGILYQAVCAGCWAFDDFPTTPDAWSTTNNSGLCNLAVLKFNMDSLDADTTIDFIDDPANNIFTIYPNPCDGKSLTIRYNAASSESTDLHITNIQGETLRILPADIHTGNREINLNLPHLCSGIYLLTIRTDGRTLSRTFSVIK